MPSNLVTLIQWGLWNTRDKNHSEEVCLSCLNLQSGGRVAVRGLWEGRDSFQRQLQVCAEYKIRETTALKIPEPV